MHSLAKKLRTVTLVWNRNCQIQTSNSDSKLNKCMDSNWNRLKYPWLCRYVAKKYKGYLFVFSKMGRDYFQEYLRWPNLGDLNVSEFKQKFIIFHQVPGTRLKCLEDPSFEFDTTPASATTSTPPKKPSYRDQYWKPFSHKLSVW